MEDLTAAGKALVAQAFADFFCKRGPVAAGRLIALVSIVHHQCTIKGILHGRLFFQQFLEDPAIAQHTGQAGHHALGCALAVFGGFDHRVHIGTVLRPQRQALDAFIGQFKSVVQSASGGGCILALIHEGKQGIVGADGLREYAKVFAWGMTKAKDMQTIRTYYSLLSFVNESEDAARLHYLKHFGLTDEGIQSLPLRPENRAYVDSMIEAAKNGEGAAECMMACLPCMLSYGWIFQKLLEEKPSVQDTLYGALVVDYADKGYEAACRDWAAFAEKVCEGLSDERLARCREIFHACSEHELNFWAMAASPRSDL